MENPCKELWYEERIKVLEANLAKAVNALKYYGWEDDDQGYYARQVLESFGYTYEAENGK